MDIEIKDIEQAKNVVSLVQQASTEMDSLNSNLTTYINSIEGSWNSNATNKETYTANLKNNITNINSLFKLLVQLVNSLNTYLQNAESAAKSDVKNQTSNQQEYKVGDVVTITGNYAESSKSSSAPHSAATGEKGTILGKYDNTKYEYLVGSSDGTPIGFANEKSLSHK